MVGKSEFKTISEWQKEIATAANKKYPNNVYWTEVDRLRSILQQYDHARAMIEIEKGLKATTYPTNKSADHRLAALVADILILCEMRNTDLENELQEVLQWFKDPDAQRSNES